MHGGLPTPLAVSSQSSDLPPASRWQSLATTGTLTQGWQGRRQPSHPQNFRASLEVRPARVLALGKVLRGEGRGCVSVHACMHVHVRVCVVGGGGARACECVCPKGFFAQPAGASARAQKTINPTGRAAPGARTPHSRSSDKSVREVNIQQDSRASWEREERQDSVERDEMQHARDVERRNRVVCDTRHVSPQNVSSFG